MKLATLAATAVAALVPAAAAQAAPTPGSIWQNPQVIRSQPTTTAAWKATLDAANASNPAPASGSETNRVCDQNSDHDQRTLAEAIVAVRMNDSTMRAKAIKSLRSVIGTEDDCDPAGDGTNQPRWLSVGRNVGAYAIAADLLNIRPGSSESDIYNWLAGFLTRTLQQNNSPYTQITLTRDSFNS